MVRACPMKIRKLFLAVLILGAMVTILLVWISPDKSLSRQLTAVLVEYRCNQALQTYLQSQRDHGSSLNNDLLTAQFYFAYDPEKTPGPYVFINLVGSTNTTVGHSQVVNAAGIFGPAPQVSACTNIAKAEEYYGKWPNSAYANNMLALIHFQQGDEQQAIQDLYRAARQVNSEFPVQGFYSNRYQGLRALAWLVINAKNDREHYFASKQLIDLVSISDVEPYGSAIVDRIPLLTLYLNSLADVARIHFYGANGIVKSHRLAYLYLKRYQQACRSQSPLVECDLDLLKHYTKQAG